jgi:hypothetical protein
MRNGLTGQRAALSAATRAGLVALGLLMTAGLAACTTVEGTNAMTDFGTFEREVMMTTARGVGLVPGEAPKDEPTNARAPLVLPKSTAALPPPSTSLASQLPADSDRVQLDTSNLTEEDMRRLRNARVVDLRSLSGRPLTESEAKALTARMRAGNMAVSTNTTRPLYLPPDEYFTRVGQAELVCMNANNQLVSLADPSCPDEVRRALRPQGPGSSGSNSANMDATFDDLRDD